MTPIPPTPSTSSSRCISRWTARSTRSTSRRRNPTGCLHDLQSFVTTTYSTAPGGTPHDTGQTMAFFNMQKNDVPYLKFLADEYTMSDNYHQPVMGGTGPDSVPLGFADQVFFSDGQGNAVTPPASSIYNPDPLPDYAQPVHGAEAVVQLLGPDPAWDQADPGLPRQAALPRADEMRSRRLLQRGEHQPGLDAARHAKRGRFDSAGHHDAASAIS